MILDYFEPVTKLYEIMQNIHTCKGKSMPRAFGTGTYSAKLEIYVRLLQATLVNFARVEFLDVDCRRHQMGRCEITI